MSRSHATEQQHGYEVSKKLPTLVLSISSEIFDPDRVNLVAEDIRRQ